MNKDQAVKLSALLNAMSDRLSRDTHSKVFISCSFMRDEDDQTVMVSSSKGNNCNDNIIFTNRIMDIVERMIDNCDNPDCNGL